MHPPAMPARCQGSVTPDGELSVNSGTGASTTGKCSALGGAGPAAVGEACPARGVGEAAGGVGVAARRVVVSDWGIGLADWGVAVGGWGIGEQKGGPLGPWPCGGRSRLRGPVAGRAALGSGGVIGARGCSSCY